MPSLTIVVYGRPSQQAAFALVMLCSQLGPCVSTNYAKVPTGQRSSFGPTCTHGACLFVAHKRSQSVLLTGGLWILAVTDSAQ